MTFDSRLGLMAGIDIPIPEVQLAIRCPVLRDIAMVGEDGFFTAVAYLTLNKKSYIQDEAVLATISNFEVFMTVLLDQNHREDYEYVRSTLTLLFPEYVISITPQTLIFTKDDKNILIDKDNFSFVQDAIALITCIRQSGDISVGEFNPANNLARGIAEKLNKGRQKIAQEKGKSTGSILSRYVSVLSIGAGISIHDCLNMTLFQVYDLMERYSKWIAWDISIRTQLAGGKPDEQPDNWMEDIH